MGPSYFASWAMSGVNLYHAMGRTDSVHYGTDQYTVHCLSDAGSVRWLRMNPPFCEPPPKITTPLLRP